MTDLEIYQLPDTYICPMCGRDPEPFKSWWGFRFHTSCIEYDKPHIHIKCKRCKYDYGMQTYKDINEIIKQDVMKEQVKRRAW